MNAYSVAVDLPCAFAYFFFLYESFILGFYLLATDQLTLRRFGWAFFITNLMGQTTYFLYPAAPPWYALKYGTEGPADLSVESDPARLSAIDGYLGMTYFQAIYSRSSNVFGALPSLHAAYPFLVWITSLKVFPRAHWLFLGLSLLTGFAAVYLCHHYVIDVLLGLAYATIAYFGIGAICDLVEERDKIMQWWEPAQKY